MAQAQEGRKREEKKVYIKIIVYRRRRRRHAESVECFLSLAVK